MDQQLELTSLGVSFCNPLGESSGLPFGFGPVNGYQGYMIEPGRFFMLTFNYGGPYLSGWALQKGNIFHIHDPVECLQQHDIMGTYLPWIYSLNKPCIVIASYEPALQQIVLDVIPIDGRMSALLPRTLRTNQVMICLVQNLHADL